MTKAVASVVMTVSVSSLIAQQTPQQARSSRASDLDVVPSIVYTTVGDQSLDTMSFKPAENKYKASPLVVYIHGGGWGGGDKSKAFNRDTIEVVRQLSDAGVTCYNPESIRSTISVRTVEYGGGGSQSFLKTMSTLAAPSCGTFCLKNTCLT